jgi:hypothetical protein
LKSTLMVVGFVMREAPPRGRRGLRQHHAGVIAIGGLDRDHCEPEDVVGPVLLHRPCRPRGPCPALAVLGADARHRSADRGAAHCERERLPAAGLPLRLGWCRQNRVRCIPPVTPPGAPTPIKIGTRSSSIGNRLSEVHLSADGTRSSGPAVFGSHPKDLTVLIDRALWEAPAKPRWPR